MKNMVSSSVTTFTKDLSKPIAKRSLLKSYVLMIPAVLLSAGVIVTGKTAVSSYGPFTIIFFRFLSAALVLFPFALKDRKPFKRKDLLVLTITGLIGFFFYNLMIVFALRLTSATNISVIAALIPTATYLLEILLFKKKQSIMRIASIILSLLAVIIVITNGQVLRIFDIDWNTGDVFILIGVLCISLYSVINTKVQKDYSSTQILLYYFLVTLTVALPLFIREIIVTPLTVSVPGIMAILYHGLLGSAATYLLIQLSLKHFSATDTMLYMNLIPIVAIIFAIIFLDESLTLSLIVSTIIISISIFLNINSKPVSK